MAILPSLDHRPVVMPQGDPVSLMLLHGVPEEDLERERQELHRVSLPWLHGPEMPGPSLCTRVHKQGKYLLCLLLPHSPGGEVKCLLKTGQWSRVLRSNKSLSRPHRAGISLPVAIR